MPVNPIPAGYPAIIPYLIIPDADKFLGFMREVFGAEVGEQMLRPDGKIAHGELRLGGSMIMLSEATEEHKATPVMLHFYVEDIDSVYARAIAAGATAISPPSDQFYGDRAGGCREPSGNTIWLATHIEDVSNEELQRRASTHG